MPRSTQNRANFIEGLDELFKMRSQALVHRYFPQRYARAHFLTPTLRAAYLDDMLTAVEDHVLHLPDVSAIFKSGSKRQWHVRGWGWKNKRENFKNWSEANIHAENWVYAMWKGQSCLYVGRTVKGRNRPMNHFEKAWFQPTTRIDVYTFSAPREIPRFECLMQHKLEPTRTDNKPAKEGYALKCPVCEEQRYVRLQVQALFPLRRRRRKRK